MATHLSHVLYQFKLKALCYIAGPSTDHYECVMKNVSQGSLRVIMFCLIGLCLDKLGDGVDSKQQDDILPRLLQLASVTQSKPAFSIKVIVCWKPNLLSVVISPTSYVDAINTLDRDRNTCPTQKLLNVGVK